MQGDWAVFYEPKVLSDGKVIGQQRALNKENGGLLKIERRSLEDDVIRYVDRFERQEFDFNVLVNKYTPKSDNIRAAALSIPIRKADFINAYSNEKVARFLEYVSSELSIGLNKLYERNDHYRFVISLWERWPSVKPYIKTGDYL